MADERQRILVTAFVPTSVVYPLPGTGFAHVPPTISKAVAGGTMEINYYDPDVIGPANAAPPAGVVEIRRRLVHAVLAPAETYPTPVIGFPHIPPAVRHPIAVGEIEVNLFDFGGVPFPSNVVSGPDNVVSGVDNVVSG